MLWLCAGAVSPPDQSAVAAVEGVARDLQSARAFGVFNYHGGKVAVHNEHVALDDVIELDASQEDRRPVAHHPVVEKEPVLVHSAQDQAGRAVPLHVVSENEPLALVLEVAVVEDVPRADRTVAAVGRRGGPESVAIGAAAGGPALGTDNHAILEEVLLAPAGVRLGVAVVEGGIAEHVAAARPIEVRRVPHVARDDVLHQAVERILPST